MTSAVKIGLVLSGGGAKGAYQVGLLRALYEMGMQVDMISGASIGALNGAVIAGAPTFSAGVMRVEKLWETLAKNSPLKVGVATYVRLMLAAGATVFPSARMLLLAVGADAPLLSDEPLEKLLNEYLSTSELAKGLPLYVSVYRSLSAITDLSSCLLAASGLRDTPNSDFVHLQSLPEHEQRNALMASAALPMLFKARKVKGRKYTDGGQGGWSKSQGNTPIQPLIDAGCNKIIVTHLEDGSFWDRHNFNSPDLSILEIRPRSSLTRDTGFLGGSKDLLGFDARKIPSWREQGYRDTLESLGRIKGLVDARRNLEVAQESLVASQKRCAQADVAFDAMLARLQSRKKLR